MLFDADVIIWDFRGNPNAADAITMDADRMMSVVTYMELLQGARDKQELRGIMELLTFGGFRIVPLSENIGHRASIYMEEYCLKSGLEMPDALVAATAVENGLHLCTTNWKHFSVISELQIERVRP